MITVLKVPKKARGPVTKVVDGISESAMIRDLLITYPDQKFEEVKENFELYLIRSTIENIAYNYRDSVYNYRIKRRLA